MKSNFNEISRLRMAAIIDIRWFRDIRLADVAWVGGKNAPLGVEMLRLAVLGAERNRCHIGICGEAPAQLGVDSISVNPSSI